MKRALLAVALIAVAATMMWAATPGAYNLKPISCNQNTENCTFQPLGTGGTATFFYTGGGEIAIGGPWSYFPANTIAYQDELITCPTGSSGQCDQITVPAFSTPLYADPSCGHYGDPCHNPTGQTLSTNQPYSYETNSYNCGRGCVKPISGVITVTVTVQ
jgi:hypothetical protein